MTAKAADAIVIVTFRPPVLIHGDHLSRTDLGTLGTTDTLFM